ncbi:hypothetical protein CH35J_010688 [Colletotrichum higginsianum]|uniref:Uncharacterized protein n=1 Tax=Colletotrichum higginsianum TaxID=80884 RepID=A0A4T0VIK0_9PEZI|nr:hypothetical protein CH35J_010688 [Colletotrichum higginsianum]
MKALAVAALAVGASAAARQRYAAVDMSPAAGALVPRFFIDAPKLAARDGGICRPNWHSCVDIGHPEICCANTNYCYVKPDNTAWCCSIGSKCDSNCEATAYQCPTTVTRAVSETVMGGAVVSTSLTTAVSSACCGRACPSISAFRCEAQFGGGCCAYGQTCVSGGSCMSTVPATTSSTDVTGLLTPADPGCTATTQHACNDGKGGCCDNLERCTIVSGTAACAAGSPTATDVRIVDGGSGGLSAGAKAGIGVGVSVVGFALAGFLAWFCFIKRRRRGTTTASMSRRSGGGGGGGSERPGRSARAMSEITSGSRTTARRGATQDYFGPTAVAGPYTETETVVSDEAAGSPGRGGGRGVPLQAHSPSDVVAPVEIDSVGVKAGGYGHSVAAVPAAATEAEATPHTTQRRYELYGSELASPSSPGMPSPSLMTPRSVTSVSFLDRSPGPPSDR